MRNTLSTILATLFLGTITVAAAETTAPAVATPAKKVEEAKKVINSASSTFGKTEEVKALGDAAYKARTKLEIALKKADPDFATIHQAFADARTKFTANRTDETLKKAYYVAQDTMVMEMGKRAKTNDKVKAEFQAWTSANAAIEDKIGELLKAKDPTKAALYDAALKTVRENR